jgi:hypothetical protein
LGNEETEGDGEMRLTTTQRDSARKRWHEMYVAHKRAKVLLWEILMHPDTTAEEVMPARQSFININKDVREVQASLEKLKVLGFLDPRL